MTTVLQAIPQQFVVTPAIEKIVVRAMRYLRSGYAVHLRGSAGTGKTTLAMHLANLLARPMVVMFGDDEFKSTELIGSQSGYTRKKVVDNYIHSVVKVEDELKHTWVDSRLTLACKEGFTLVYDEFNRSRPEGNNVLLSILEEKLIVLPPTNNQKEYIRVHPDFRAIFTSNPEEYCGVHSTQDALLDRLVTINIPEPDELTQLEILVQKTEISRAEAMTIVRLVHEFRRQTNPDKASGLRSALILAQICRDHQIPANPNDEAFREICSDVLISRSSLSIEPSMQALRELLSQLPIDPLPDEAAIELDDLQILSSVRSEEPEVSEALEQAEAIDETVMIEPEAIAASPIAPASDLDLLSEFGEQFGDVAESANFEFEVVEPQEAIEALSIDLDVESPLEEIKDSLVEFISAESITLSQFDLEHDLASREKEANLQIAEPAEPSDSLQSFADGFADEPVEPKSDAFLTTEMISATEAISAAIAQLSVANEPVYPPMAILPFEEIAPLEIIEPPIAALSDEQEADPQRVLFEPVDLAEDSLPNSLSNSLPDNVFETLNAMLSGGAAPEFLIPAPQSANELLASDQALPYEHRIVTYLHKTQGSRLLEIERSLKLERSQMIAALKSLLQEGKIAQRQHLYVAKSSPSRR